MLIFDASIRKCKNQLAKLYTEKHEIENKEEDTQAIPGSELEKKIHQIDTLIEGDYSRAVFYHFSESKPLLIRNHTGEEVQWLEAFGNSYEKTTLGQRHSLVGLVEGGGKYRIK